MILSGKSMVVALAAATLVAFHNDARAQSINAGGHSDSRERPFVSNPIADFDRPWALAFLPDGQMLVTEKLGKMLLVAQTGQKREIGNVPAVDAAGQNGLLDIAVAPDFARSSRIYFTYTEPGSSGSTLVLARAQLTVSNSDARLVEQAIIWRQSPSGGGGQPGGIITFDPEGRHLFLAVGDRMQARSAQDPDQARGKVVRLDLDGGVPRDNPGAGKGGIVSQTWTTGHRNPYGLAFAADGRLWLHEMGPRGGDEFNLIIAGQNYGWPDVSNGDNYSGLPIPRHATRPEFAAPAVYWTPVIAPAGLAFYEGDLFPRWRGSALIGGLAVQSLVRLTFDSRGRPDEADRWDMGARIRDVAVAADGAVWLLEDGASAKMLRLTPRK
jgi:glucose/arabinose dehydrogenase